MLQNAFKKFALSLLTCLPLTASAFDWQQFIPNWPNIALEDNDPNMKVFYGPFAKNHYQAENLTIYGPVSLTNSTVDGTLRIYGPAALENTTNNGIVILFGIMNAANSTLNDIHATTTELKLTNTSVNHIVILKNDDNSKTQHVYLSGSTTISGNIIFEQGNGKVVVTDEGIISKDKVIGGKIKVK
jgi:hypothetical protein